MVEKLRNLREKLKEKTGYASMLEVYGTGELLLTGCRSLLDFSDSSVSAVTVSGGITVRGRGLSVCAYRADLLLVSGTILEISFAEGEKCS